ncbi:TPA: RidA family protein [Pseudomonas aeruginosa]|uniref:RidA family protein n=1 Tax=Pseudomonas aeruginosa TaxID=287 RepID=UPI00051068E3|nr:RidA family protein [Pseudomonas aeruginosa]EKG0323947.1 RidA family protein [Pseudomonas aeruginosa]KGB84344.1 translation initiation inhibitor [Pseudomonas aeruginosa]KSS42677.1 translation initiation inhibitor [Pseudomonas aeruginosa]MBA4916812.1 RidA family protein [Pseudomonas aeruginosa]MBH4175741.1 RidA family protein [Pseudomonas aeruginosa]
MTAVRRIRAAALPDLPDASWSNALLVGEELVMSGMTAHPATRQALVVLGKVKALLEAAGGHVGNLYKLNVYVSRIADKDAIGRARQEFFAGQGTFPASTLVEVSGLVFPELLVEIDAWARLDIDLANCDEA